jgi:hypothetical protein
VSTPRPQLSEWQTTPTPLVAEGMTTRVVKMIDVDIGLLAETAPWQPSDLPTNEGVFVE